MYPVERKRIFLADPVVVLVRYLVRKKDSRRLGCVQHYGLWFVAWKVSFRKVGAKDAARGNCDVAPIATKTESSIVDPNHNLDQGGRKTHFARHRVCILHPAITDAPLLHPAAPKPERTTYNNSSRL